MKVEITTEIVSTDEFEEIGEFKKSLEMDGWKKVDISKEMEFLYANANRLTKGEK